MDTETIALIIVAIGGFFVCRWLFPPGSLGYLRGGRDHLGKWHWWWDRGSGNG